MSSFRNERGNLLQSLMLLSLVAGVSAYLGQLVVGYSRVARKKVTDNSASLSQSAVIETLLVAYRYAELAYLKTLNTCGSANPFLKAMREGSGCASAPAVTVFTGSDGGSREQHPGMNDPLYSYVRGCTISTNASTCGTGSHELLRIDNLDTTPGATRALAGQAQYRVHLNTVVPTREIMEFTAVLSQPNQQSRFAFAIRGSLTNAAHLEADGRVTQENPDPLARCAGAAWATFAVFDPGTRLCQEFIQLGSGTGLAFYGGRYFGFRPADGQVIDMLSASINSPSYLVDTAGNLSGQKVFVPYDKNALVNVDDITIIADQLYYVAGSSTNAHIGLLDGNQRVRVCELGAQGWGQSYEGIAALGRSDPLKATAGDGFDERLATFYLKTSGGDLLTANVIGSNVGPPYHCYVFRDQNLQQVEYKRTNGFDRTDASKPYYLY